MNDYEFYDEGYDYSNEPIYGDIELGVSDSESVSSQSQRIRKSKSYPSSPKKAKMLDEIFNIVAKQTPQNEELYAVMPIQTNTVKTYRWNCVKTEWLNHYLTIFFHVSLMISFEIMFYFKYIIDIEKTEILNKLANYVSSLNENNLDESQQIAIQTFFSSSDFQTFYADLYKQYRDSLSQQREQQITLLVRSLEIASIFYCIFLGILVYSLRNKKNIKWNWIIAENVVMFTLLGIFEFLFFTQIIMNYNPLTDAEIKYYVVKDVYGKFG